MADQHKWFKLWVTAPQDDGLQSLPPEHRWAWAVLGCYTKQHGTNGTVEISPSNQALAGAMCVKPEQLKDVIEMLPHLCIHDVHGEGQKRHGTFTVTWRNWVKYQEDSTQKIRSASRRKRRGEENRIDKKRRDSPLTPHLLSDPAPDERGAEPPPPGRSAARVRKASSSEPEALSSALAEFMRVVREKAEAPGFLPPRGGEAEV